MQYKLKTSLGDFYAIQPGNRSGKPHREKIKVRWGGGVTANK